jgi:hypothetical protein
MFEVGVSVTEGFKEGLKKAATTILDFEKAFHKLKKRINKITHLSRHAKRRRIRKKYLKMLGLA